MKSNELSFSRGRRLKNQFVAVVTNPYNVIVLIAIILLAYLIVVPLIDMLSTTFTLSQRDLRAVGGTGHVAGEFTFYYWQRLLHSQLTKNLLVIPLLHSLEIGFAVSLISILIGAILVWLMVRSDLPLKPFFSLAVIIPYMIPSWVKSQAWLSMFRTPRIGGSPGFFTSLMLASGISNETIEAVLSPIAYGPVAIIIVLSLHYYAYTYLLVSAALNSINSELEEMGEIQGASKALILRRITLPLVLPAMLSAVILTFSKAIGTFGVINYLGSPAGFRTLTSELYSNNQSQNTQTAFAMAILMILFAAMLLEAKARKVMLLLITMYGLLPVLVGNAVTWPVYCAMKRKHPERYHRMTIREELLQDIEKEEKRRPAQKAATAPPPPPPPSPEPEEPPEEDKLPGPPPDTTSASEEAMLLYTDEDE